MARPRDRGLRTRLFKKTGGVRVEAEGCGSWEYNEVYFILFHDLLAGSGNPASSVSLGRVEAEGCGSWGVDTCRHSSFLLKFRVKTVRVATQLFSFLRADSHE